MNKYWPKDWKKAIPNLPNFLGEDFFSTIEHLENMDVDAENVTNNNQHNISSIKVNIYESGHELLCIFRLPGLILREVDIDVYDRTLTLSGSVTIDDHGFRPIQEEIFEGIVRRKVELPYSVRTDRVEVSYHHGHLIVHLHRLIRSNESKPKIIIHDLDSE